MDQWRFYLVDREIDVGMVIDHLPASGWLAHTDGERTYLTTSGKLSDEDVTAAYGAAESWCNNANVVLQALLRDHRTIGIGDVACIDENGRPVRHFIQSTVSIPLGWESNSPQTSRHRPNQIGSYPGRIPVQAVLRDQNLTDAFRLFNSAPDDWTQLYKIIEMAEGSYKRRRKTERLPWVSSTKLGSLKRTAQFPATAGDTARHAVPDGSPPSSPMPLEEAQTIVRNILYGWLTDVAEQTD